MAPTEGILYVTMQPQPSLPPSQFHDWYNNEHGPLRLRLPFITNGFRYRASDLPSSSEGNKEKPEWLAIYDVTDMKEMVKPPYTTLREPGVKTPREMNTMKQIHINRRMYDFIEERHSSQFVKLEEAENEGKGNILVAVSLSLLPGDDNVQELNRWYQEEHIDLLSKVPGWLRTRRYKSSIVDPRQETEWLALHEYAPKNGLDGPEFKAATTTPWRIEIFKSVVREQRRRVYDLAYTFGAAPRHLDPKLAEFTYTDGKTKTIPTSPGGNGAIESYVTTKDGAVLPFRLEGSSDPKAPLLVLSNSILVNWGIWDDFVASFFSSPQNKNYRVVRYLTRGRSSQCGEQPVTVDILASDIIALLDALRVPKAAALIGVSLGGATVLCAALKHPKRVAAFISCDTSSKSPAGNSKAWGDRIAIAEKESAKSPAGQAVVGEQLAEITVRRWFVKESYDGASLEKRIGEVKRMVQSNSLEGFKKSVQALYEYDLQSYMKDSEVKGAFVVGGGDGVLPGSMKEMAAGCGPSTTTLEVIEGAGHLPMVEKPKEFEAIVTKFLTS